ncbi:ThiF family adenylyltransferase [Corallococcus exercitus]|uniref:ThiF family adenylyltransferase n=1 Tax=Corallococcus exercitus TaxID=2316736 RepID=UPI001315A248|nr:ThiF family adenylyltransferase [Corallococcus exercitus]
MDWLRTDDWAPEELRSRGALPEELRRSWIPLLGAGALGSAVAEMLVRGGVRRLVVVDPDIDCTASNDVLHALERIPWDGPRLFFSASFGVGARRVLCFSATGTSFPVTAFWEQCGQWIREDYKELLRADLPREGVGCWHPVFPARADDVMLAAAITVKALVRSAKLRPTTRVETYSREGTDDDFQGVRQGAGTGVHAGP